MGAWDVRGFAGALTAAGFFLGCCFLTVALGLAGASVGATDTGISEKLTGKISAFLTTTASGAGISTLYGASVFASATAGFSSPKSFLINVIL